MSDEAQSYADEIFETSDITSEMMDDTPDSFDDLMGEAYDSNSEEVSKTDGSSDNQVLSKEGAEESAPVEPESGQSTEETSGEPKEEGDESGQQGEGSSEVDPIQKYLSEQEEVKADGKIYNLSREELIAKGKEMVAGEIAWDRKFSELDRDKQSYKRELSEVEGYINRFGEIAQKGDVLGALQYFSEFTALPPHVIKQQLIQQLAPEIDRLRSMDEAEVQLEFQKEQNNYLQKKYETENQKFAQSQAVMEAEMQARSLQQTHNIAQDEWNSAVSELQEHPDVKEVTPELVANYISINREYIRAESLLDTVDVSLKENDRVVEELRKIIKDSPDYTDDDLKEIINSAFGGEKEVQEQAKKIQEKMEKHSPKQLKPKVDSKFKPITIDGEEIDDFEDLI